MIITILSGKGGTGKTTLSTSLALSLENVQLLDADVEEPNDYLFLEADFAEDYEVVNRDIPVVNEEKCTFCRKCIDFCQYNALSLMLDKVLVFPEVCHSCGGCKLICPEKAITEQKKEVGKILQDQSGKELEFIQGELNIGEESAVPVIEILKNYINPSKTVIIDAPPGTTCPAIEAVIDSDYAILITEPTPFGLHDLKMAVAVMEEINKPFGVVINRSEDKADELIEEYCRVKGIQVQLKIPFSRQIAELYAKGIPFVKEMPEWKSRLQQLYREIEGGNR